LLLDGLFHVKKPTRTYWSLTVNPCREKQEKWRAPSQATTKSNNKNQASAKRKQQQTAPEKLCTANRKQQQIDTKQTQTSKPSTPEFPKHNCSKQILE
jgi:hypothetical protein